MKKKKGFLAILLCACMLIFVGCGDGGPSDFGGDNPFGEVLSMDGVKVLSKPVDYAFGDAVGENSVNYYNEFAREVLYGLYNIYENPDISGAINDQQSAAYFQNLDTTKGETFGNFNENDKYYLYDSLRYTIKKVENTEVENNLNNIDVYLDYNSWVWTSKSQPTFFDKLVQENPTWFAFDKNENKFTINSQYFNDNSVSNWVDLYVAQGTAIPAFSDYYYNGTNPIGETKTSYFTSPYYQAVFGKQDVDEPDAKNFFQDALEYATYLFVLGYDYVDYVDTDGETKNDKDFFDFEIETDSSSGEITNILVGGWENEKISVSNGGENSALGRVKKLYEELGSYVGLTDGDDEEGNIQQIERFIKDIVIGETAWGTDANEGGKFEVQIVANGTRQPSLHFNRNYEKIVENVVRYACTKAPIGEIDGVKVTLDSAYLASDITDYKDNYFEPFMSGESLSNYDDDKKFDFIEAAEYQSIIFQPSEEDFDLSVQENSYLILSMLTLSFEYWDDVSKTYAETQPNQNGKKHAQSITINVGLRYFDHKANAYTANAEVQKTIEFGKFPRYEDYGINDYGKAYDKYTVSFSDTDTAGCIPFDKSNKGKELQIKTKFTSPAAIDAFANGQEIEGVSPENAKRIRIGGGTNAREYYKFNKSSSYGYFGTLNSDKFAGDEGCDFIEVYFDVVKEKGKLGVDYSFKVCTEFLTMRESQKIY